MIGQFILQLASRANYTKIENDNSEPNVYQKETIFQRLGRYPDYYVHSFLSEDEFYAYKTKGKIISAFRRRKYTEARELLEKIENMKYFKEKMGLQFVLNCKSEFSKRQEQLKLLKDAIKISIPNFKIKDVAEYYLSYDELQLINRLGNYYCYNGDVMDAVNIYKGLMENMDSHYVDEYEKVSRLIILRHMTVYK